MVAEVVEAAFCVGEESAGGGAHAVAIGPFDDVGGGGEGGSADGVVLGASPEAENDEVGFFGIATRVGYERRRERARGLGPPEFLMLDA